MAIVNLTATAASPFPLSATAKQIPSHNGVNAYSTTVEVGAADSDTSTYLMGRFPSNARIQPGSFVGWDDLASTGSPTLDVGTFNVADGTADDDNALNDGLDAATANTGSVMLADVADWGATLWSIAGASSDPGGWIDVKVTLQDADVNVGGTLSASFFYTVDY